VQIAYGLRTSCVVPETMGCQEDEVVNIVLDVWLYGALASYGDKGEKGHFANLKINLPEGSTMGDLLKHLGMPTE